MLKYLAAFGCSAVVLGILDAVWLTVMGNRLYKPVLKEWMSDTVNLPAAAAFYVIFLCGLTFLATAPGLREASAARVALNAAVFGFVAYATYDLTNQATLTRWSMSITLADMAWGTFLSVTAALAGYYGSRFLVR